jgi:hypothetical protein
MLYIWLTNIITEEINTFYFIMHVSFVYILDPIFKKYYYGRIRT